MNVFVRSCRVALLAAVCAIGWSSTAQVVALEDGANAGSLTGGLIQRLDAGSFAEEGCFPPCMCITHHLGAARGVWRLTPTGSTTSGLLEFRVDEVEWIVGWNTFGEQRVRGSGVYRVSNPAALTPLPPVHQLTLDLSFDGQPTRRFDSGLVVSGFPFPRIDISISLNQMVCYDTVIHVKSSPVPAREVSLYSLRQSAFLVGCFNGCTCPVSSRPVAGTMLVVPMRGASPAVAPAGPREFGVLNVRWRFLSTSLAGSASSAVITGSGLWKVGPLSAIPETMERLVLDLRLPGEASSRFDSGDVLVATPPPRMDMQIAENGFACFDRVFVVRAAPVRLSVAPSGSVAD